MSRASMAAAASIAGPFTLKVRVLNRLVSLRLSPDLEAGGFVVSSSNLRGLNTQGDTLEDAIKNGKEAAAALLTEPRRRRHA